ncbi:hypothetical protein [Sporosarcina sp. Te-1]|uniref:hypothetical protein n=1 Tax=Sporosarcina sp. Te-1 TaxID=2818390 RepID=UPI001A9D5CA6|nr:hypothetical protein [Sporosarcina sp. Te-1]QTD40516.1 hypothetical protein J3U78_17360 [Sporosarcina sp. Te-1]
MRAIQQEYGIGAELNEKFPEQQLTWGEVRYTERDIDRLKRELADRFYAAPSTSGEDDMLFLAMKAMQHERMNRIEKVVDTYWALSNGYISLSKELANVLWGVTPRLEKGRNIISVADQQTTRLMQEGTPFTASLPDLFWKQVMECGSWQTLETSNGLADIREISAIGLMKELLRQQMQSGQPSFFFEDQLNPAHPRKILPFGSTLHVERIRQRGRIDQVIAIQVRLVNSILSHLDAEKAWIAPIYFQLPAAFKVIDLYNLQMQAWKNGARLTVCLPN